MIRTGDINPEVAIDGRTGALYAVWQDADFSGGAFDEVAFTSSTDGGATWTAPKRISTPTGRPAFTQQIAVTAAGTVGVTDYDFRNLTAGNTTTLPTDYWFTSSANGGQTWSAGTASARRRVVGRCDPAVPSTCPGRKRTGPACGWAGTPAGCPRRGLPRRPRWPPDSGTDRPPADRPASPVQ